MGIDKGTRPNIGIGSRRCRSIGCRFFPIPFSIGTDIIGTKWNGIGNGSKFFIRPINRSHQILTYICQRLPKGWNRRSCYVTDKNYIGQCLCPQMQSVNDRRMVPCIWLKCVLFQRKISDKCLHRRFLMEDNTRQYEEFLYQIVSWRNSELFNNAEDRRASLSER